MSDAAESSTPQRRDSSMSLAFVVFGLFLSFGLVAIATWFLTGRDD
jgi:hypothetical protein